MSSFNSPEIKIKLFADGADQSSLLTLARNPLVQGFTTNPSLIKEAGVSDYTSFSKNLLKENIPQAHLL